MVKTILNLLIEQGYGIVVRQLGMAIANKPQTITSMGIHGFEMSLQNSVSFIDATRYSDGSPSPWNLAFSDEQAPENLWIPSIHIKGLPLSLEVGARTGMIQGDTGSIFGTYLTFLTVEGYRKAPEILVCKLVTLDTSVTQSWALELMDASVSLGKSIPFGPLTGVDASVFRPFVGGGMYWLSADPRLQPDEADALGIYAVSAFKDSDAYVDGYQLISFDGGFEIESNEVLFSMAASYSPGNILSLQHQFGFSF